MKLIDKKELVVELKKKKFFGAEVLETKNIKLIGLANKCDFEKEVSLKGCNLVLSFHLHEPIK